MAIINIRQPIVAVCAGCGTGFGPGLDAAMRSAAWNPSLKNRTT